MTTDSEYTTQATPTFNELDLHIRTRFAAHITNWSALSDEKALRCRYEFANGAFAEMQLVFDKYHHYDMNGDTHAANYFRIGVKLDGKQYEGGIREPTPQGFERAIEQLVALPRVHSANEARYRLRKLRTRIGFDPTAVLPLDASGEVIEPVDERFREVMDAHGALICKGCGRELDRGDVAWNTGSTEVGTPFSVIEIICQGCNTEAAQVSSWTFDLDSFESVVSVLAEDWN